LNIILTLPSHYCNTENQQKIKTSKNISPLGSQNNPIPTKLMA